jgi:hypothetical protein
VKSTRKEVAKWMDDSNSRNARDETKYKKKVDYLEKKAHSIMANYKEVTQR